MGGMQANALMLGSAGLESVTAWNFEALAHHAPLEIRLYYTATI